MRMWPISTTVNKPENDDSSITEPIELERAGCSIANVTMASSISSGAFVFKTLSTTGASNMAKAADYPVKPVMLVAGDDAREEVGTKSAAFDNSGR
jgi:hypothetical protein